MIKFEQKGSFNNLELYLKRLKKRGRFKFLEKYGEEGVKLLAEATPKRTGLTSRSWQYKVEVTPTAAIISFYNTNIQNGINVAVVLQYGHATRRGGWVEGRDYINPAIEPLFDKIAEEAFTKISKKK